MTLRDDINNVIKESNIKDFSFVRLSAYQALLNRIAKKFLIQGRADLQYVWLWERFIQPIISTQHSDVITFIEQQLPKEQKYWFLASEEDGKYWVADCTGESVFRVIKEMYCFEYYIVERKLNWILCENHHGVLIQTGVGGILTEQDNPPDPRSAGR